MAFLALGSTLINVDAIAHVLYEPAGPARAAPRCSVHFQAAGGRVPSILSFFGAEADAAWAALRGAAGMSASVKLESKEDPHAVPDAE